MNTDELRALAEAATPGPWEESRRTFHDGSYSIDGVGPIWAVWCNDGTADIDFARGRADLDYVKAVSPDVVLGLLDRIRELESQDQLKDGNQ